MPLRKGRNPMTCTNCGKLLADDDRFCSQCGTPAPAKAPKEPEFVFEFPAETPADIPAPAEEPAEVPAGAPVSEEPAPEEPSPEAPAPAKEEHKFVFPAPEMEDPIFSAPAFEEPASEEPVTYEIPTYSDAPLIPAPKLRKRNTHALIVVAVVFLLLAIAGGAGYYIYSQYTSNSALYTEAAAALEKRDYDGALAMFEDLGGFRDADEQAQSLNQLQSDYDAALALLDEYKFGQAKAAFAALGDYRDSENYANREVNYQMAAYILSRAPEENTNVLGLLGMPVPEEPEAGDVAKLLYTGAAELFDALGNYRDAKDQASRAWLGAALTDLSAKRYDEALSYMERLDEEDAIALDAAYKGYCADKDFLTDVVKAYKVWYDEAGSYSTSQELSKATALIQPYTEKYFDDSALKDLMRSVLKSLDTMTGTLDEEGIVTDWVTYYTGMAGMYAAADQLHEGYDVFSGSADLVENFVGLSEAAAWYPIIEADLADWWDNEAAADLMDGHFYAAYTNDSGRSFTLYATIYFYDADGNLLETGKEMEILVVNGSTVYIPTIPEEISDDDWSIWGMDWWFTVS